MSMDLSLTADSLVIRFSVLESLAALHAPELEIPLRHLRGVSNERPAFQWMLRAPGTSLPGVLKAGTYRRRRGKEFWYARGRRDVLVLELEGHPYRRVVLTPDDAFGWAEKLRERIA